MRDRHIDRKKHRLTRSIEEQRAEVGQDSSISRKLGRHKIGWYRKEGKRFAFE